MNNYLILLKTTGDDVTGEAAGWFPENSPSRGGQLINNISACFCIGKGASTDIVNPDELSVPEEDPWVIIAYIKGDPLNQLCGLLSDNKYRVFFHSGGLNAGVTTLDDINSAFKSNYPCLEKHDNEVMYYSQEGGFTWNLDKFKQSISKGETEAEEIIQLLDVEWDKAQQYFNVDSPAIDSIRAMASVDMQITNNDITRLTRDEWLPVLREVDALLQENRLWRLYEKYLEIKDCVEITSNGQEVDIGKNGQEFKEEFQAVSNTLTKIFFSSGAGPSVEKAPDRQ